MTYEEKERLYNKAKKIHESSLRPDQKYDLIFSDDISAKFDFDYVNWDGSYEDDVMYYMEGFDRYMKDQKAIHEVLTND